MSHKILLLPQRPRGRHSTGYDFLFIVNLTVPTKRLMSKFWVDLEVVQATWIDYYGSYRLFMCGLLSHRAD